MIIVCHRVNGQFVLAHYPENDVEEREEQELVRVSTFAQRTYARVGLWILAEMEMDGRHIVVTSINRKVDLSEKDLAQFRIAIIEKLKGEKS